ncbi:MAG: N-acetylmuramoyl-L-alanine amidase [Bacteriovoracia bacterium]
MLLGIRKLSLITLLFVTAAVTPTEAACKPFLVVLDPGHGGSDHGAIYKDGAQAIAEKDLTLLLSREVAAQLQGKGVRAVLTRREDLDMGLTDRTAIANRLGANLFISLHMNSARDHASDAEGFETYILNNSTDASSKRLADLENAVLEGSKAGKKSDVSLIVKDLLIDANLSESKHLACKIQGQLVGATKTLETGKRKNRGVKQALFYVLLGADMPSVLVEAGFMSSVVDRTMMMSKWGRHRIAQAIVDAVTEYRRNAGTPRAARTLASCRVR